jgi:predicted metal-dependent hydrolase
MPTPPPGPALTVGLTTIPYAVRPSARARVMKLVVTPDGVEAVVPPGTAPEAVEAFVHRKRRWLFGAVRELNARHETLLPQQFASGAKLQVRGRWLMLDVQPADVPAAEVSCRSKLHVRVPAALGPADRGPAVRAALEAWQRGRALDDLERLGRHHAATLGATPAGFRLSDARARWGSCGRDGLIRAHWQLAQAPLAAFEYVIAHELTHLLHRNHSEAFWRTLSRTLPGWREQKALLERWEVERRAV